MANEISNPISAVNEIEASLNNLDSYIKVMRCIAHSIGADDGDGDIEDALNVVADDFARISYDVDRCHSYLFRHFRGGSDEAYSELSPIMAVYPAWHDAWMRAGDEGISDEERDLRCDKHREIGRKLLRLPVTDAADFAAKILVHTCFGDYAINASDGDGVDLVGEAMMLTKQALPQ